MKKKVEGKKSIEKEILDSDEIKSKTTSFISIQNLTKKYGNFTAVNDLNLEIIQGEIIGLIGHNGAGKTTTFVMLTGLTLPTSGKILIDGVDIAKDPIAIKENIGFLPDGTKYYTDLTARQNLDFFCELADSGKDRIDEILKLVKLDKFENRKVGEFSKGMIQRVGIAQALIKNPKLIILDEPTSGIDPEGRIEFNHILKDLNKQGISIIIASHSLDEVQDVCNRIAIIKEGKLVAYDKFENLLNKNNKSEFIVIEPYHKEKLIEYFIKNKINYDFKSGDFYIKADDKEQEEIAKKLMENKICLKSFSRERTALADVFMGYYKRD